MFILFIVAITATVVAGADNKTVNCTKIPQSSPEECCPLLENIGKDEDEGECAKSLPSDSPSEKELCAFSECHLSQKKLLTPQKSIDYAGLKAYMKTVYPKSQGMGLEEKMKKCMQIDTRKKCDALKQLDCVFVTIYMSCPDDVYLKTAECAEMKTFIANCPLPFTFDQ